MIETKVVWPHKAMGFWDQGMTIELLEGKLWPLRRKFRHVLPEEKMTCMPPLEPGEGAVVVSGWAALLMTYREAALFRPVMNLPWSLFLHTSDEELKLHSQVLRSDTCRTWLYNSRPRRVADWHPLMGWRPGTREIMSTLTRRPLSERWHAWFFAGQTNHKAREDAVASLRRLSGGLLRTTTGFGQGDFPEFLADMTNCAIAPCPAGWYTPETSRIYDALEAGCLPVVSTCSPLWKAEDAGNYWHQTIGGEPPFPCLDEWTRLGDLIDYWRSDLVELQRAANRATAWWLGYKRLMAKRLCDDVDALTGVQTVPLPRIVLTPAGFADYAPDRMQSGLEVVVLLDGSAPASPEREERNRLIIEACNWDPRLFGCLPMVFDEDLSVQEMARRAMEMP